jgi:hypothetical protein
MRSKRTWAYLTAGLIAVALAIGGCGNSPGGTSSGGSGNSTSSNAESGAGGSSDSGGGYGY